MIYITPCVTYSTDLGVCIESKELAPTYPKLVVAVTFSGLCYGPVNVTVTHNTVGDPPTPNIYIG